MEIRDLMIIVEQYDRKIAENTSLNKQILRTLLLAKPEKRINREKAKGVFAIVSPAILLLVVVMMNIKFQLSARFYVGVGVFSVVYIYIYIRELQYFLSLRNINFSVPVVVIKRQIIELEKQRARSTKVRYLLMPILLLGVFLMFMSWPISWDIDVAIMCVLLTSVIIVSFRYKRYLNSEQFKALNREITELEELEK